MGLQPSSKLPLIINVKFITPDTIGYVGGKEANVYKFYADGESIEDYWGNASKHDDKSQENEMRPDLYEDYMKRDGVFYGKNGVMQHCKKFNRNGFIDKFNPANTKSKAGTTVWSFVISLNSNISQKNNINSQALGMCNTLFRELLAKHKKYGWTANNVDWCAVTHTDKAHHHIHMKVFQPESINLNEVIEYNKINLSARDTALVQMSKELVGLKQDDESVSKARDELRCEFNNFINDVINNGVGEKLRDDNLKSKKINDISQLCKVVKAKFWSYGVEFNFGNLLKPVAQKEYFYEKLDTSKFESNLNNYSKDNIKEIRKQFKESTHVKTEHEWNLMGCKADISSKPIYVYAPVYKDQLNLKPKERIDAEQKYVKDYGIKKFQDFAKQRIVDHYEKVKVFDVKQVVKLESKNISKPEILPEQRELTTLIDNFIKSSLSENPKLKGYMDKFNNETNIYFDGISKALDPEHKTNYTNTTVQHQKQKRFEEMYTTMANAVLKTAFRKDAINKSGRGTHVIAHNCKRLTSELEKYLHTAFMHAYVNKSTHISEIDHDINLTKRSEQMRKTQQIADLYDLDVNELRHESEMK